MNRYMKANKQMNDPYDPSNYSSNYQLEGDFSPSPSVEESSNMPKYAAAAKALASPSDGGTAGKAGNAMMAAGAIPSPASPYLLAGGLGLSVVGQSIQAKKAREAQAVNNEIARRERVMQLMSNLGSGFGGLG